MPQLFIATFRLDDSNRTRYNRCYTDLNNAIQSRAHSKFWQETTSFYLFDATGTSIQIADAVVAATPDFDPDIDLLLIMNVSQTRGHAIRGKPTDRDIYPLLQLRK